MRRLSKWWGKGQVEMFEIGNPLAFGLGGLQVYLERAALTGPRPSVLVISLRNVRHIDAVGVRCIAQSVRWSQAHGCRLFVTAVNPVVRRSLESAGVLCEFLAESALNAIKDADL